MRRPRLSRRLAAVLPILLGAVGHFLWWYSPREREGTPPREGRVAALLADSSYPLRLWLPFPHQNLGALSEEVGDLGGWLAAASRLLGTRPPRLPAFGPFPFPPGRHLVVAADPGSDRLAVKLAAYPSVAVLARLAGTLASNPWLAGGPVRLGDRAAEVSWEGRTWSLVAGPAPAEVAPASDDASPTLGRLVVRDGVGWLPSGVFRVERVEDGLWLAELAPPPGLRARLRRLEEPGLALAVAEGEPSGGTRAFAVWAPDPGGTSSPVPAVASLARAPAERWRLPGEHLFALTGRRLPSREQGTWTATAFESRVAERALPLAQALERSREALLPASGGRLVWGSPGRLAAAAGGVADLLSQVPIFGAAETGRWRDIQAVLAPFADCREMAAVLPAPAAARLSGSGMEVGLGAPPALLLCGSRPSE